MPASLPPKLDASWQGEERCRLQEGAVLPELHIQTPPVTSNQISFHEVDDENLPRTPRHDDTKEEWTWSSNRNFLAVLLSCLFGVATLWRFPYLSVLHGGAVFLVPYLMCMVFVALPLLQLEMFIGQLFRSSHLESLSSLTLKLTGVAGFSLLGTLLVTVNVSLFGSWSLFYFLSSAESPVGWADEALGTNSSCESLPSNANMFLYSEMLGVYEKETVYNNNYIVETTCTRLSMANAFGNIQNSPAASYILFWVAVFAFSYFPLKSLSKVIFASLSLVTVIYTICLATSFGLDGSEMGRNQYFRNWEWHIFQDSRMWVDALTQSILSTGIGSGIIAMLSSNKKPNGQILKSSCIVVVLNLLLSFMMSVFTYNMLGHISKKSGEEDVHSKRVVPYPISVVHVVISEALAESFGPSFLSTIFYFGLFFFQVTNCVTQLKAIQCSLLSVIQSTKCVVHPSVIQFALSIFCFIVGIELCKPSGIYYVEILDHFVINYLFLPMILFFCIGVGWTKHALEMDVIPVKKSFYLFNGTFWASIFICGATFVAFSITGNETQKKKHTSIGAGVFWAMVNGLFVLTIGWTRSFQVACTTAENWFHSNIFFSVSCMFNKLCDMSAVRTTELANEEVTPLGKGKTVADCFAFLFKYFWCTSVKYFIPAIISFAIITSIYHDYVFSYPASFPEANPHNVSVVMWTLFTTIFVCIALSFFLVSDIHHVESHRQNGTAEKSFADSLHSPPAKIEFELENGTTVTISHDERYMVPEKENL